MAARHHREASQVRIDGGESTWLQHFRAVGRRQRHCLHSDNGCHDEGTWPRQARGDLRLRSQKRQGSVRAIFHVAALTGPMSESGPGFPGPRCPCRLHGFCAAPPPTHPATSCQDLSKTRLLFPDGGWRTTEHAPEGSIHVALVTESRLKRNGGIRLASLP